MRIREDRDRKFHVPKVPRHSLTKYGGLSWIDRIEKHWPSKMAETAKFLVRKTPAPFPYMLSGSLHPNEALCQAIQNFTVPHPPRHFLYKRVGPFVDRFVPRGPDRAWRSKQIFVSLSLCRALRRKGVVVPALRDPGNSFEWIVHSRARLARRRTEKPATKAGQIWALWPDIEAALQAGQSVKSIHRWLEEDVGIILGITSLTSYISRIRRRIATKRQAHPANGPSGSIPSSICNPPTGCDSALPAPTGTKRSSCPSEARSISTEARHPQTSQRR